MSDSPAVLFDVGDTLIRARGGFGGVYAEEFAAHGIDLDRQRLDQALSATGRRLDAEFPPGFDRYNAYPGGEREFWRRFVVDAVGQASDGRVTEQDVDRVIDPLRDRFLAADAWEIFPDTRPALAALRESGARLAIVSNWDSRLPRILDALQLTDAFDVVVVSGSEGLEKPRPELFHRAMDRLGGVPAGACLHIGDRHDMDGDGAAAAGIDVRIIQREPPRPAGSGPAVGDEGRRYATITSLMETVDWVRARLEAP